MEFDPQNPCKSLKSQPQYTGISNPNKPGGNGKQRSDSPEALGPAHLIYTNPAWHKRGENSVSPAAEEPQVPSAFLG